MSSLTSADKRYIESILDMSDGYPLDFTDTSFAELFNRHRVDIHAPKYQSYGTSKAKKLRSFWEQESDVLVGSIISELLDTYVATCEIGDQELDNVMLLRCRQIVAKLTGNPLDRESSNKEAFLSEDFKIPSIEKLPVLHTVKPIIQDRLKEVHECLKAKAHLSVIFLCGSVLEAVLLGAAQNEPQKFNRSPVCPKKDGKVRPFHEWKLSELIDVATDIKLLKPDVQKFSHGLRDFRNYIHPYQQVQSGFRPDEYTGKLCFQALKAALASVAGDR